MTDKTLKQIILDMVLPGASILDDHPYFFSTTTYSLGEEELEQIEKLREAGIRFTVSVWPAGVLKPDLKDKTMERRLVLRFEYDLKESDGV